MALVLALDVSSSVGEAEDRLQRDGLARALLSPDVQDAFFASSDPVALQIFEWSGRGHQTNLRDWMIVQNATDLQTVAAALTASRRTARGLPTAMGHALAYASLMLQRAPVCAFQTIDIAGDGANNAGFGSEIVYTAFPFEGVTVNGLVVQTGNDAALEYYENSVIRGPLAFVEVADGFADFEATMRRKLIRELSSQIIGRGAKISIEGQG